MSELSKKPCPICELDAQDVQVKDRGERKAYKCARCGSFKITRTAERQVKKLIQDSRLSAWIRDRNERGLDIIEIHTGNIKEILERLPNYTPREKMMILLKNLERMSKYPGDKAEIVPRCDIPLAWANSTNELMYYLQALSDRGLILLLAEAKISDSFTPTVAITADGWDYLEESEKRLEEKTQVFVAMSFSKTLNSIWKKAIEPAINEAGFRAYRVDAEPHIDRIDAKIITEIRNSRFLVADVTEQKRGVYFEAGYALGMNLPVIWTVREDDLEKVHFDTRQYNHIVWESEEELRDKLYDVICAVIGKVTGSDR